MGKDVHESNGRTTLFGPRTDGHVNGDVWNTMTSDSTPSTEGVRSNDEEGEIFVSQNLEHNSLTVSNDKERCP